MKRTYKQIKEEKNKQTNYREIERTNEGGKRKNGQMREEKNARTNEGSKERIDK